MLINKTSTIIAIDIVTGVCRNDFEEGEREREKKTRGRVTQMACTRTARSILFFFMLIRSKLHCRTQRKERHAYFRETHTIRFVTIRSSITWCTLTHRLIILLNKTNASIVTNKRRAWINLSITCWTFKSSMTFASVRCTFIDTITMIA